MSLSDEDIRAAEERAAAKQAAFPKVISIRYDQRIDRIVITLASGLELGIPPKLIKGLAYATPSDLDAVFLTPSGLGIHFPLLDEDLYLPTLVNQLLAPTH